MTQAPSQTVVVSSSVRRLPITPAAARSAVLAVLRSERAGPALISVAFVGTAAISRLNRDYLGKHGPTDVISFRLRRSGPDGAIIGDIYICVEVAKRNARAAGIPVVEELLRLVVHGTLHVFGHDHPEGENRTKSAMWRKQERILARIA